MLHSDVVAWMQQVWKAVQSVLEHNGSEYNSLLQQIITKVCWDQSYCAWGPAKAVDWWSALYCGILLPHHSSQLLLLSSQRCGVCQSWAREEGEVMEVVDSLRTNSREIW